MRAAGRVLVALSSCGLVLGLSVGHQQANNPVFNVVSDAEEPPPTPPPASTKKEEAKPPLPAHAPKELQDAHTFHKDFIQDENGHKKNAVAAVNSDAHAKKIEKVEAKIAQHEQQVHQAAEASAKVEHTEQKQEAKHEAAAKEQAEKLEAEQRLMRVLAEEEEQRRKLELTRHKLQVQEQNLKVVQDRAKKAESQLANEHDEMHKQQAALEVAKQDLQKAKSSEKWAIKEKEEASKRLLKQVQELNDLKKPARVFRSAAPARAGPAVLSLMAVLVATLL